jgi:hypothetical protein
LELGPHPGWHAIGASEVRDRQGAHGCFLEFDAEDRAGDSIDIHNLRWEVVNRVFREMGLPELPADWAPLQASAPTPP